MFHGKLVAIDGNKMCFGERKRLKTDAEGDPPTGPYEHEFNVKSDARLFVGNRPDWQERKNDVWRTALKTGMDVTLHGASADGVVSEGGVHSISVPTLEPPSPPVPAHAVHRVPAGEHAEPHAVPPTPKPARSNR